MKKNLKHLEKPLPIAILKSLNILLRKQEKLLKLDLTKKNPRPLKKPLPIAILRNYRTLLKKLEKPLKLDLTKKNLKHLKKPLPIVTLKSLNTLLRKRGRAEEVKEKYKLTTEINLRESFNLSEKTSLRAIAAAPRLSQR